MAEPSQAGWPATREGLLSAIGETRVALDHIEQHLGPPVTDEGLACAQTQVADLMVSLPTWAAVLARMRHSHQRRN